MLPHTNATCSANDSDPAADPFGGDIGDIPAADIPGAHLPALNLDDLADWDTVSLQPADEPVVDPPAAAAAVAVNHSVAVNVVQVADLRDEDVPSRRGTGGHPGRRILNGRIQEKFVEYDGASKPRRKEIAQSLLFEVKERGGRMLKWDDSTQRYYEMSNKEAIKNIRMGFDRMRYALNKSIKAENGEDLELGPALEVLSMLDDGNQPGQNDVANGAKGTLIALLSSPRGEEIAQSLLSIVDVVESVSSCNRTPNADSQAQAIKDDAETEKAIKSLLKCKPEKRARRAVPDLLDGLDPAAAGTADIEADAKSRSITTAQSVMTYKQEEDLPKLEIKRRLRTKPDREYTGSMMDGKAHGIGVMSYDNGRVLVGNWRQGVFQGQGCAIYENGDKCFGSFYKNKIHGIATYITDAFKYVGQYHGNKRNGKGVYNDYRRGLFDGDFCDGKFEGTGTFRGMNGKGLRGDFKNWKHVKKVPSS